MSKVIKRKNYEKTDNLNKQKRNKGGDKNFIFIIIILVVVTMGIFFTLQNLEKEEKVRTVINEVIVEETKEDVFKRMDKEFSNEIEVLGATNREIYYEEIRSKYE